MTTTTTTTTTMTMTRQNRLSIPRAAVLAVVLGMAASLMMTATAKASNHADRQGTYTEEFHKVYPLSAQGRFEIENINGPVHITGWDRPEVKVDAIKSAWNKDRLAEARIEVDSSQDRVSIRTEYPSHDRTFSFGDDDEHNNPARVEYTISVPRQASLDKISLVNGRLDIQDVTGEVRASCVNGRIEAHNLQGRASLNTVNGSLVANVAQLPSSGVKLSSVNGKLHVTLPSDTSAEVEASTVSGNISNDFGLTAIRHQYVGHSLHGQLGGVGAMVKLSNVNGTIEISHASDGKTLSPATNLERGRDRDRDNDNDRDDDDD